MTKNVSATISDEQAKFAEEEDISLSKLLQKAIERRKQEKETGYGQVNISEDYNTLTLSLRNYPTPVDSRKPEDSQYPVPLYKNDEGELVEMPPVEKEEVKDDVTLIVRKDDGEVCGAEISNWEEHRDFGLVYSANSDSPYVVLDPPRL